MGTHEIGPLGFNHFPQFLDVLHGPPQALPYYGNGTHDQPRIETVFIAFQDPHKRVQVAIIQSANAFQISHCRFPCNKIMTGNAHTLWLIMGAKARSKSWRVDSFQFSEHDVV